MALLVVFVAAFVMFVVIVALLLFADLAERKHLQRFRIWPLSEPFAVLSIAHAFDPERAVLWDTQMPALRLLNDAGGKGCSLEQLYAHYVQLAGHYPELYEGSSFEQWVAFLISGELVRVQDDRVLITLGGQEFLHEFVKCRVAAQGGAPASR